MATSPPIGEAFARDSAHDGIGALLVCKPKCHAIIIPEVKFTEIALQMILTHVVIDAIDAALEDRKVTLDRIRVRITANVFADRMYDSLVRRSSNRRRSRLF